MSQILAPGNTAASTTPIVLAQGESATVGIFSASPANVPGGVNFEVVLTTPGAANPVITLNQLGRQTLLVGPGTYEGRRPAYTGTAFGFFLNA